MSIYGAAQVGDPLVDTAGHAYDALLVMSYGGPEGHDDVMPFLENATRGRNVPRERLLEVAEHYHHFGGVSPINRQNLALIEALRAAFAERGPALPIYFGNRNWHPFVTDTLRDMRRDGVNRALAFVTSAFSSYSGCRQYREDIVGALETIGDGEPAFPVDKLRVFYNHPGFIAAMVDRVCAALQRFPEERRGAVELVFTAHSIPSAMARGCDYEVQLAEACRLVAGRVGDNPYHLAYQSRSGPPRVPWLGPDIVDDLEAMAERGQKDVIVAPIGFISDHMEVLFDLDTEARERAAELGMTMVRAETAGTHPAFVEAIRGLVLERMTPDAERPALGERGPNHDICPVGCCLPR